MSLDALLLHTAEIYRRTGQKDRFGQDVSVNPRQHQVGGETLVHTYKCRANRGKGGLLMEERYVDVFQQRWTVYFQPSVDILDADAVRVLDEKGNELVPISKVQIKSVAADSVGSHHLEIQLWAQSA